MQQLTDLLPQEELALNPLDFTIADVIDIAKLLNKEPTEIFEIILNDLKDSDLIRQCEEKADELLRIAQYKH